MEHTLHEISRTRLQRGAYSCACTCVEVPRTTLARAVTESSFTCYKLLSRIQEPFLFVKRHAVSQNVRT
jgi:hypothetical protein